MNHGTEVRLLQILNHILLCIGVWYVAVTGQYDYLWLGVVVFWITGVLGINVCLHRYLSHKSFKTYKAIEVFLIIVSVLTTVGSPLAWVAVHRQHHRFSDEVGDPHSPHLLGKFRAWFGLWGDVKIDLNMVKDLRRDALHRAIHKNYVPIIAVYCILLALVNPWLVIFAYAIPACLSWHAANLVVVMGHMHGYRNYNTPDKSTNSWFASLLTWGDGWHNNHHANLSAWSNWVKWWEFDIATIIIRAIKK